MDDVLYLAARYTLSLVIENRTMGTSGEWVSISAKAIAEHADRRLTGHAYANGDKEQLDELREEAARTALGRVRRQVEALEAL